MRTRLVIGCAQGMLHARLVSEQMLKFRLRARERQISPPLWHRTRCSLLVFGNSRPCHLNLNGVVGRKADKHKRNKALGRNGGQPPGDLRSHASR